MQFSFKKKRRNRKHNGVKSRAQGDNKLKVKPGALNGVNGVVASG